MKVYRVWLFDGMNEEETQGYFLEKSNAELNKIIVDQEPRNLMYGTKCQIEEIEVI